MLFYAKQWNASMHSYVWLELQMQSNNVYFPSGRMKRRKNIEHMYIEIIHRKSLYGNFMWLMWREGKTWIFYGSETIFLQLCFFLSRHANLLHFLSIFFLKKKENLLNNLINMDSTCRSFIHSFKNCLTFFHNWVDDDDTMKNWEEKL